MVNHGSVYIDMTSMISLFKIMINAFQYSIIDYISSRYVLHQAFVTLYFNPIILSDVNRLKQTNGSLTSMVLPS